MKKNIKKIRKQVESQGIVIEPGKTYNIYECGHVILNSEDPKRFLKDPDKISQKYRACYECSARFLTKYRSCGDGCGVETVGKNVRDGGCKKCRTARWNSKAAQKKSSADFKNKNKNIESLQAHRDRFDCFLRDDCLNNIAFNDPMAEYLPCYQCKKYCAGAGGIDPMEGVFRERGRNSDRVFV